MCAKQANLSVPFSLHETEVGKYLTLRRIVRGEEEEEQDGKRRNRMRNWTGMTVFLARTIIAGYKTLKVSQ